jgi:hypothetical protein
MIAALWQGELMTALGAVVEDGISDRQSQKQNGGNIIAQAAAWLCEDCCIFRNAS